MSSTTLQFSVYTAHKTQASDEAVEEISVTIDLGLGREKMKGLVLAPSPDQSVAVIASVTPDSKAYGKVQPGFRLIKINAMDVTTMDYTAVRVACYFC